MEGMKRKGLELRNGGKSTCMFRVKDVEKPMAGTGSRRLLVSEVPKRTLSPFRQIGNVRNISCLDHLGPGLSGLCRGISINLSKATS